MEQVRPRIRTSAQLRGTPAQDPGLQARLARCGCRARSLARAPTTGDEPASLVACWRRRAAPRHPGPIHHLPAAVVQLQHAAVVKFHNSGQGQIAARFADAILDAILICDNFLYGFKGTPSARHARRPRPVYASRREQPRESERPG